MLDPRDGFGTPARPTQVSKSPASGAWSVNESGDFFYADVLASRAVD
jgi:hypothetical protein